MPGWTGNKIIFPSFTCIQSELENYGQEDDFKTQCLALNSLMKKRPSNWEV